MLGADEVVTVGREKQGCGSIERSREQANGVSASSGKNPRLETNVIGRTWRDAELLHGKEREQLTGKLIRCLLGHMMPTIYAASLTARRPRLPNGENVAVKLL
jgi:hypothetical protein